MTHHVKAQTFEDFTLRGMMTVNTFVENFSQRVQKAYARTGLKPLRKYGVESGKAHPLVALAHLEGRVPRNQSLEWRFRKSRYWLYKNFSKDFIDGFNAGWDGLTYDPNQNNEFRQGFRLGRTLKV
jgi:hypothetical protein